MSCAIHQDTYRRAGDRWHISGRTERTLCLTGGKFAGMIRGVAAGD